jgi:hypothetical protein
LAGGLEEAGGRRPFARSRRVVLGMTDWVAEVAHGLNHVGAAAGAPLL